TAPYRRALLCAFAALALSLASGCASPGPKYSVVKKDFPALASNQGRIFFYRESGWGGALRPNIHLNGVTIGESVPGECFYRDVPPGHYTVETHTEASNEVSFKIAAGQVRYVKISIGMGSFVGHPKPRLMEPSDAESDLDSLAYVDQVPEPSDSDA